MTSVLGYGCKRCARIETPRKSEPRIVAIHTKVVAAFVCLALYWGLFSYLFRLGALQVLCCLVCIGIVKLIAILGLTFLLAMLFVAAH